MIDFILGFDLLGGQFGSYSEGIKQLNKYKYNDGIKLGSKSYPYLAVAKHYGIDYGVVLRILDKIENGWIACSEIEMAVLNAYDDEMNRRK